MSIEEIDPGEFEENYFYCDFSPEAKLHIMATVRAKGKQEAIQHLLDFGFNLKVCEALVRFCIKRMNK